MKNLKDMSDEELALSYMEGNNKAFDLLLEHTQSRLFSYILFIVRDEDVANDVFQDTFIKIIVKLRHRKYAPTGKFAAWCMRIAHNVVMDQYRLQKTERIVEPTEDNDLSNLSHDNLLDSCIETRFVNEQVIKDIHTMMDMLPTSQREVVYMRFNCTKVFPYPVWQGNTACMILLYTEYALLLSFSLHIRSLFQPMNGCQRVGRLKDVAPAYQHISPCCCQLWGGNIVHAAVNLNQGMCTTLVNKSAQALQLVNSAFYKTLPSKPGIDAH